MVLYNAINCIAYHSDHHVLPPSPTEFSDALLEGATGVQWKRQAYSHDP